MKIFVINPGSTSTKAALFESGRELWKESISHPIEIISTYKNIAAQLDFRYEVLLSILAKHDTALSEIDAFAGRGGLLHPLESGTWIVNEEMVDDLLSARYGSHASNLGGPIAERLAKEAGGKPAYIVDPVVVDERIPEAKVSGMPEAPFLSIFHALNQRAVAHRIAKQMEKNIEECRFIVAHLGGGVSIGAHEKGRIIDVNQALGGFGPMSPERAGTIPGQGLVDLCFSGLYTKEEIQKKVNGLGGVAAHLGTTDFREVLSRVDSGEEKAILVFNALCHQIAKEIGAAATVLQGNVDAIILTGGLAYSDLLCSGIKRRVDWIASVITVPGEDELLALAEGVARVMKGEENAKIYRKIMLE